MTLIFSTYRHFVVVFKTGHSRHFGLIFQTVQMECGLLMAVPPFRKSHALFASLTKKYITHKNNDTTRLSETMIFPLELAELLSQATLVMDNARSPVVSASSSAEQIPVLSTYSTAAKNTKSERRQQQRRKNLLPSMSPVCRWESAPVATKQQEQPLRIPVRKARSLDRIPQMPNKSKYTCFVSPSA